MRFAFFPTLKGLGFLAHYLIRAIEQRKEYDMEFTRKNFLKMLASVGTAITVPQALCGKDGIDKYLTHGPNPPKHPIVNGFDNKPHYPVMESPTGETTWDKKSPFEIVADFNKGVAEVQERSRGIFIPSKDEFCIAIPPSKLKYLKKKSSYGVDVEWYIRQCWPKAEIFSQGPTELLETSGWNGSSEFVVCWCSPQFMEGLWYTQYGI